MYKSTMREAACKRGHPCSVIIDMQHVVRFDAALAPAHRTGQSGQQSCDLQPPAVGAGDGRPRTGAESPAAVLHGFQQQRHQSSPEQRLRRAKQRRQEVRR
jgi:hypothetical protein